MNQKCFQRKPRIIGRIPIGLAVHILFFLMAPTTVYAQQATTDPVGHNSIEHTKPHEPSPGRAAMLSATFPGLGQLYNQKYWKAPIIYAGFGTLAYFIDFNNSNYRKWREAWIARVDGNPNTVDDFPIYSDAELERAMNFYRRNLEITYVLTAALYLLNILDASVDAHLMAFDVGEELTMGLHPAAFPSTVGMGPAGHQTGLTLRINF